MDRVQLPLPLFVFGPGDGQNVTYLSMDRGDYLRIDRVWLLVEKLILTKVDKPNATVGGGIDKVWL